MAVNKTGKRFSGVRRDQRVRIDARRDDTRSFRQRLSEATGSTAGTAWLFGGASALSLALSWAPFIPELIFVGASSLFYSSYRFKKKRWSLPIRVPSYINKMMGMKVLDATTGKAGQGNIYLGKDEESGEEIWVNTSDLNKHALLIGTTGSGKTEAIMGQLFGFIALNSGGLLVDGKASTTTFDSVYTIARLFGRDADLLTMDYLTGGIDVAGLQRERRSHTYNPLFFGGPAQKSETMVSLLDGGDPMWSGRAMTFIENVIPPLSYLSDRGYIVLNPKLLGAYGVLEQVENLILFGVFRDMHGKLIIMSRGDEFAADWSALKLRSGGIVTYLEGLPGYSSGRPALPHKMPDMTDAEWSDLEAKFRTNDPPMDANARNEVTKQHGFIQMQLTRSITNLSENYGFIYGAEKGEIDYSDMVLNRRLMVVLLPALERSPENLKQLGKMTTLSLKSVLGSMLNTNAEGKRREIIDGNPSKSKIPFLAILDEVGYYMAPGLAVVPAQARSLGVALAFGTQSITDLMKADEHEGKSIIDNTAVKFFGRLTSDENSDTARTAISMGGEVHVQVADEMQYQRGLGGLESNLKVGSHSGLQTHSQIAYDDLARQENGEFHIIIGTRDTDETGLATGGARVVRSLSFFTGNIRRVEDWIRNPFCNVNPPSKADQKKFREAEIMSRKMRDAMMVALDKPTDKLSKAVTQTEGTYLQRFLSFRRESVGAWPADPDKRAEHIRNWLHGELNEDVRQYQLEMELKAISGWREMVLRDLRVMQVNTDLGMSAIDAMTAPWFEVSVKNAGGVKELLNAKSKVSSPKQPAQAMSQGDHQIAADLSGMGVLEGLVNAAQSGGRAAH